MTRLIAGKRIKCFHEFLHSDAYSEMHVICPTDLIKISLQGKSANSTHVEGLMTKGVLNLLSGATSDNLTTLWFSQMKF